MAGSVNRSVKRGASDSRKDFTTGHCMTCASLVRWPKELDVFKCVICATINDKVHPITVRHGNCSPSRRRFADADASAATSRGEISSKKCKQLARQCIQSYLVTKLCSRYNNPIRIEPEPSGQTTEDTPLERENCHNLDQISNVSGCTFDEPTLQPNRQCPNHATPRSQTSPTKEGHHQSPTKPGHGSNGRSANRSMSQADEVKRIFKPLEDYIFKCFSSFDIVNTSFMTVAAQQMLQQPVQSANRPLPIRRKPVPSREPAKSRQPVEPRESAPIQDLVSSLDPKLLLLGDIAENGMWWTGGQHGSAPASQPPAERPSVGIESRLSAVLKSPMVDFVDLRDWYNIMVNTAEGWLSIYELVMGDADFIQPTAQEIAALERNLLHAQVRLQRVLLKITELLLRRPGRPITHPTDLRFLLIVMENPLLYSDVRTFKGLLQPETVLESTRHDKHGPKSGILSGHHSGVIKRIIGLISNSSSACHGTLVAWFARFPPNHFLRVKDLISGFLTYRMLRQNDNKGEAQVDIMAGLIPEMQVGRSAGAYLHDEIGYGSTAKTRSETNITYANDWQVKAASSVLALLFAANNMSHVRHSEALWATSSELQTAAIHGGVRANGQILPTSEFYNLILDNTDLVADFESWESKRAKFSFCQYPFLLSIWAKTRILEHDARRQMQNKARDAFFDSIMTRRNIKQYLTLDVRRDCLVDDSLQAVSEVVGSGSEDVKKALRITFRGEEGIDGGGLRKEWFLLLIREVFNPYHGMFLYDEDSQYCYFNPSSFETSDQFFLVGVVMGLAIYNSTILDVALPPFAFRKLLAAAPAHGQGPSPHSKPSLKYTLEDLAEYRPRLARGLQQLLDYDGDVEQSFCLEFAVDTDRYGTVVRVPLFPGGERKPVTNSNRREYADLYVRHVLDTSVARQFEPFKRGFYTVCGGNAFSLFRPEEVGLLVRGSEEALDIAALRAVAEYDGWGSRQPDETEPVVCWFWETFEEAAPADQRKMLSFITGSDRIPAMGAAMLRIKLSCLGDDCDRFPIARTCFNLLSLWRYESKEKLERLLWRAVNESEGFGLK